MTSSSLSLRRARAADLARILALMPLYYAEDHLEFDETRARGALTELLANEAYGGIYLIEAGSGVVGYLALCTCFSLEFGGREAFVDELFVLAEHRGLGFGSRALALAIDEARALGLRALRLETTPTNARALALYERLGFRNLGRSLLAYPIAIDPTP